MNDIKVQVNHLKNFFFIIVSHSLTFSWKLQIKLRKLFEGGIIYLRERDWKIKIS